MKKLLLLLALAGCAPDPPAPTPPPPSIRFVADEGDRGSEVFLRGQVEGEGLVVDVVARGLPEVHGIAFRLRWDVRELAFVEARGSDAWSKNALVLAREGLPGELVVTWTEKGSGAAVEAREETTLGSIRFDRKADAAALSFRPDRSMLLDAKGKQVAATWRGGRVAR